MAERGAPEGNNNAGKNKPWAEAVRRALLAEDGKKLRLVADMLIERALQGDVSALKELGDRLDGKAPQAIVGADGGPVVVEIVRFADSDPK